MSPEEEQVLADLMPFINKSQIDNYCMLSTAVLLIYEHVVLTFAQERQFIWSRKFTGVTVLFLSNKLCGIGFAISIVLSLPNWSADSEAAITRALLIFLHLSDAVSLGFACLRVYAISGRSWRYTALVFFLGSISFAMGVFDTVSTERLPVNSFPGFLAAWPPFLSTFRIMLIINCVLVIVRDVVVLFVTWTSTYKIMRDAHLVNMKVPLATLLLRDGTAYFVFFLLLDIAYTVSYLLGIYVSLQYFVHAFSSINMSRFILNLREIYLLDTNADYAPPSFVASQASDLRFVSPIVGNMGAPLSLSIMSPIDEVRESLRGGELLGSEDGDKYADVDEDEDELDEPGIEEVPRVSRNPMAVDFDPEEY